METKYSTLSYEELTSLEESKSKALYAKQLQIEDALKSALILALDLKVAIGVRFGLDSISIFTCEQSFKKGLEHPYSDFGTDISIDNHTYGINWLESIKMFKPKLNTSSLNIDFSHDDTYLYVTKNQILAYLSKELFDFSCGNTSDFVQCVKDSFVEYRTLYYDLIDVQIPMRAIERTKKELFEQENEKTFLSSFKVGNWYELPYNPIIKNRNKYSTYVRVGKITDKSVEIHVFEKFGFVDDKFPSIKRIPIKDIMSYLFEVPVIDSPLNVKSV